MRDCCREVSERLEGEPEVPPLEFFEACHSAMQDRAEKNGGGAGILL